MRKGENLALEAMRTKWRKLLLTADRAKQEVDEYMDIATEMLAIHKEFAEIVKSKDYSDSTMKKLDSLKKRSARAEAVRKKDLLKLLNNQAEAESNASALAQEISLMETRIGKYR